jgi:hypothetical protein
MLQSEIRIACLGSPFVQEEKYPKIRSVTRERERELIIIIIIINLVLEFQWMWNVIALVTGATGTISKSLGQYLEQHTGKTRN